MIAIARGRTPVAKLVPAIRKGKREFGAMRGKISMVPSFLIPCPMTSWIDGVDNACDCTTAAPIVLDNIRRFEEAAPSSTRAIRRAAIERRRTAPRRSLTQNAPYGK